MKIVGISASEGIAISKAFKLEEVKLNVTKDKIDDPSKELKKLSTAIAITIKELSVLRNDTLKKMDEDHAKIFDAHIQIASDPELVKQVEDMIMSDSYNGAYAFKTVSEIYALMFEEMDNEYFKERALDVRDVARRVIAHLLGQSLNDPSLINEEVIVVANDLTPSDTAQLNKKYVKGFVTNIGGRTSHSAIMARSLEIPAVVGTINILENVNNNDKIIIDGKNGDVIINPTKTEISKYQAKQLEYFKEIALLKKYANETTITKDGKQVELAANIGSPDDIDYVLKNGGEGVGLYRTEFLYMNNDNFPTEDEQFIAYKMVLELLKNKKVIIRTLDIGGDKQLEYLKMDKELNPFLGQRALRYCLENPNIFKTQLRALLRSSIYGDLHIMFPMVATLDELRDAKKLLKECEVELLNEGRTINDNYKVGIMVEIPAVAILADQFAKEVDFFSIGTNDLIQYTFAADRMNQKVAYLYQPCNPSLLRLIKLVIDASHKAGIWTGMCGEMAADMLAAPILLGLGLDEFSMSASSILKIRYLFSNLNYKEMKKMAEKALSFGTSDEVRKYVNQVIEGE